MSVRVKWTWRLMFPALWFARWRYRVWEQRYREVDQRIRGGGGWLADKRRTQLGRTLRERDCKHRRLCSEKARWWAGLYVVKESVA